MVYDSDCEGSYDDPFEGTCDDDEPCDHLFDVEEGDEGCLGLCGGPSDEEDADGINGEGMCEVPCCFEDDEDDGIEDLCVSTRNDDDGKSVEDLKAGVDADVVDAAILASILSRIMAL
jgi:hypothetical protein